MLPKLSVKRSWFLTAAARRAFPAMAGSGVVLDDAGTGARVRVRVAGRVVSVEPTHAAAAATLREQDVDQQFRMKARRVSMSHDLPSDAFDPTLAHVPSQCAFDSMDATASTCYVEAAEAAEAAPREAAPREAAPREAAPPDAALRARVAALFTKLAYVSRHVPLLRLPLASVTFEYLNSVEAVPEAVLTALGGRYLTLLQETLRRSEPARAAYVRRCQMADADAASLRQEIMDATWE